MWTFRAMSTDVAVAAPSLAPDGEEAIARAALAIFDDADRRFSRFRPDSELSRLNASDGATPVSPAMLDELVAARAHVLATGGMFDPAVGDALVAAGYDRGFTPGALDRSRAPAPTSPTTFLDVGLDVAAGRVTRPAHVRIDLGGIVKGRTVDRAARLLPEVGMVDAGGDVVVRGAWRVDVEDPADASRVAVTLAVRDRAIATSAPNRRRWRAGSGTAHHLIDPRTRMPAVSDLAQATALATTAEAADVLAKVAFLLGATDGARFLEQRHAAGVLVGLDGRVHLVGDVEVTS